MYDRKGWRISMFKLRRLAKLVKKYVFLFQYQPEEFRDNIDFYIEDSKEQIIYATSYISSTQNKLDELYKVNMRLSSLNSIFVLKPFTFVTIKLLKKWIDVKNKNILACKKYKKYFENLSEQIEMMKYLCDL